MFQKRQQPESAHVFGLYEDQFFHVQGLSVYIEKKIQYEDALRH